MEPVINEKQNYLVLGCKTETIYSLWQLYRGRFSKDDIKVYGDFFLPDVPFDEYKEKVLKGVPLNFRIALISNVIKYYVYCLNDTERYDGQPFFKNLLRERKRLTTIQEYRNIVIFIKQLDKPKKPTINEKLTMLKVKILLKYRAFKFAVRLELLILGTRFRVFGVTLLDKIF
jgi:hypothetical protein